VAFECVTVPSKCFQPDPLSGMANRKFCGSRIAPRALRSKRCHQVRQAESCQWAGRFKHLPSKLPSHHSRSLNELCSIALSSQTLIVFRQGSDLQLRGPTSISYLRCLCRSLKCYADKTAFLPDNLTPMNSPKIVETEIHVFRKAWAVGPQLHRRFSRAAHTRAEKRSGYRRNIQKP
jgi:hypothetical protein